MTEIETLLNESLDKRANVESAEAKYQALVSLGYIPEATLKIAKEAITTAQSEHSSVLAKLVPIIMTLDDQSLVDVMMLRYAEGKTVKEIAEARFLCTSQIFKKIKKAKNLLIKNAVHSNAT